MWQIHVVQWLCSYLVMSTLGETFRLQVIWPYRCFVASVNLAIVARMWVRAAEVATQQASAPASSATFPSFVSDVSQLDSCCLPDWFVRSPALFATSVTDKAGDLTNQPGRQHEPSRDTSQTKLGEVANEALLETLRMARPLPPGNGQHCIYKRFHQLWRGTQTNEVIVLVEVVRNEAKLYSLRRADYWNSMIQGVRRDKVVSVLVRLWVSNEPVVESKFQYSPLQRTFGQLQPVTYLARQ